MSAFRILVVDDSPANRAVLSGYIESLAHDCLLADNGRQALDIMRSEKPDLVLLDVMMPEMDGCELLGLMKGDFDLRHIPVIMVSALDDMTTLVNCIERGADDYLLKPFNPVLLRARITAGLEKKRYHDAEIEYRRQLEEANRTIEAQNAELRDANAIKDKFISIANHDIRNPLTVIFSGLHVMQNCLDSGSITKEIMQRYLGLLRDSSKLILSIVNDFLDYRKIESGSIDLDIDVTDVNGLVSDLVDGNEEAAAQKGIVIGFHAAHDLPFAMADGDRLKQVLANLVSNAIKFSPLGGTVILRTLVRDKRVRVEVQDSGPGVKPHERPMLFNEFAQISNKPTGGEKSTGLGLAISKKLIEAQGGRIGAEFPVVGGSLFWLDMPVFKSTPLDLQPSESLQPGTRNQKIA